MKKKVAVIITALSLIFAIGICDVSYAAISSGFKVYLCGIIDSDGVDRMSWIAPAKTALLKISNSTVETKTSFSSTELAGYIKLADLFAIHTHGDASSLKAVNGSGTSYLYKTTIDSWRSGTLSDLKLAFLGACSVGYGGSSGNNIVNSMYAKGAKCVIGYKNNVVTACNRTMLQNFNIAIGYGYTIQNALAYADARVLAFMGSSGGTDN